MSVRQAQSEVDSREFAEWMAFYQLEPWGREVEDRPAALVASTIANIKRPRGKKAYTIDDFSLKYDRACEHQDWREQADILKNFTIAMGGTVK